MSPSPALAMRTSAMVRRAFHRNDRLRRCRRKRGKGPKNWMLKRVKLKTELVVGSREARTVKVITAALVEREEG